MFLKLSICALLTASLFGQTTINPNIIAHVVSPSHPAFASVSPAPDFGQLMLVFGKRGATEQFYRLTITYTDNTQQTANVEVKVQPPNTPNSWTQICLVGLHIGKIVQTVKVAPLTIGTSSDILVAK